MKKSGIQMAVTTVIMIILSITILTILIIFVNSQTGFLSKYFRTQTTESNVDVVVSACDNLVTTESVYAYCCEEKEVSFGEDKGGVKMTCAGVALAEWSGGRVREMDCSAVACV
jgi:hypothetical protein